MAAKIWAWPWKTVKPTAVRRPVDRWTGCYGTTWEPLHGAPVKLTGVVSITHFEDDEHRVHYRIKGLSIESALALVEHRVGHLSATMKEFPVSGQPRERTVHFGLLEAEQRVRFNLIYRGVNSAIVHLREA